MQTLKSTEIPCYVLLVGNITYRKSKLVFMKKKQKNNFIRIMDISCFWIENERKSLTKNKRSYVLLHCCSRQTVLPFVFEPCSKCSSWRTLYRSNGRNKLLISLCDQQLSKQNERIIKVRPQ